MDVQVRDQVLAMDYPAREGGMPTPLELLLASLAGCAANTLALVLTRKMGVAVESLEVEARAELRAEHPTVLTDVELSYTVKADFWKHSSTARCVPPRISSARCWPCCGGEPRSPQRYSLGRERPQLLRSPRSSCG